ncbi:hypothetical protein ACFL1A_01680 [Patescibacteria group bacterium]
MKSWQKPFLMLLVTSLFVWKISSLSLLEQTVYGASYTIGLMIVCAKFYPKFFAITCDTEKTSHVFTFSNVILFIILAIGIGSFWYFISTILPLVYESSQALSLMLAVVLIFIYWLVGRLTFFKTNNQT